MKQDDWLWNGSMAVITSIAAGWVVWRSTGSFDYGAVLTLTLQTIIQTAVLHAKLLVRSK